MAMRKKTRGTAMAGLGLSVILMAGGLGGCVNQVKYDQLRADFLTTKDRNAQLARENDQLREALDLQNNSARGTQTAASNLERENANLRERLAETNLLLEQLDSEVRSLALIDPKFDQALRGLADRYPNVIIYDADRGMLRFASDLTFGSGSDQVREGARQTLAALADVIKTQTSGEYELQIVGHTDAEPISSSTAQRHPTNTHLSVHRAISVKAALVSLGLPSNRVMVAGWGESRPAVANNPGGNTPQNRRVEVFFRPSSLADGTATAGFDASSDAMYNEPTK